MNKYLSEIDILASNRFGETKVRLFVDETRNLIRNVNLHLKRQVKSRYGKVSVYIWPLGVLEKYSLPKYEFDTMSGVCVINFSYDLNNYFSKKDKREMIIYKILQEVFTVLPIEVGLDGQDVIDILES